MLQRERLDRWSTRTCPAEQAFIPSPTPAAIPQHEQRQQAQYERKDPMPLVTSGKRFPVLAIGFGTDFGDAGGDGNFFIRELFDQIRDSVKRDKGMGKRD